MERFFRAFQPASSCDGKNTGLTSSKAFQLKLLPNTINIKEYIIEQKSTHDTETLTHTQRNTSFYLHNINQSIPITHNHKNKHVHSVLTQQGAGKFTTKLVFTGIHIRRGDPPKNMWNPTYLQPSGWNDVWKAPGFSVIPRVNFFRTFMISLGLGALDLPLFSYIILIFLNLRTVVFLKETTQSPSPLSSSLAFTNKSEPIRRRRRFKARTVCRRNKARKLPALS